MGEDIDLIKEFDRLHQSLLGVPVITTGKFFDLFHHVRDALTELLSLRDLKERLRVLDFGIPADRHDGYWRVPLQKDVAVGIEPTDTPTPIAHVELDVRTVRYMQSVIGSTMHEWNKEEYERMKNSK